jgi:hypothetical protein
MTTDLTTRYPWEPAPPQTVEQTVQALQRDFAYAVVHTCVVVHSDNPAFAMMANSRRGQIVPRGEVKFNDGTTVELQDIGMCQPGLSEMTIPEIMARIWRVASELGLELAR